MDDLVYLIGVAYTEDEIGQLVPMETERAVWASIQSVTRAEWAQAGQAGLNPELVLTMPRVNYNGQKIVELRKDCGQVVRYGVYRTYFDRDSDEIELYLEQKAGVTNVEPTH